MLSRMTRELGKNPLGKARLEPPAWEDLRIFLEVTRKGSFTQAAVSLGLEQSTVSRRIASLESGLDAALFDRSPSGATLTPLGDELKRHVEAMEAEADRLFARVTEHEREIEGIVRLALTESIALHAVIPRILPGLSEKYPKLELHLLTSYEVAALGHREAEIALRFFRPESGDLVAQRLLTMETALIGHERFQSTPLSEVPLIGVQLGHVSSAESDYVARYLRRAPWLLTGSYVAQIEAVRRGLGVALLPREVLALDPHLVALESDLPPGPVLELWLVTPRTLRRVPRIAAVWTALETGFRAFAEKSL